MLIAVVGALLGATNDRLLNRTVASFATSLRCAKAYADALGSIDEYEEMTHIVRGMERTYVRLRLLLPE